MAKITPTTGDTLTNGGGVVHIAAPHEPLHEYTATQPFQMIAQQAVAAPPVAPQDAPQPLKVALVGTAPSSRMLAPFGDPSWEIWACSPGNMNTLPRVTTWFELHSNLLWPEHVSYGAPYIEWLKKQTFPIYMQDQSLVPNAIVYPKDEMVAEFGRFFFTSSFSWMMALAIKKGALEIGMYGIDMASHDEYVLQRPGGHYFIQTARAKGIKVTIPNESDLDQPPPLYAYSDSSPFGRKIQAREAEVAQRIAAMEGEAARIAQNLSYLKGALEDIKYVKDIWGGVQS